MNLILLNLIVTASVVIGNEVDPEVTIKQGTLRGKIRISENGKSFNAFTGIPYAKPPINELRFKRPQAAAPWNGVLDATKPHSKCLQAYSYFKNFTVTGSEDCLYLNVYTPQIEASEKLAVMLFIHGGGFITGSAADYDPSLFMNHDIIVVTINYRLGALGFMTTASNHLRGNDGLKDQVLAIKWVRSNIDAFGGDPSKITVFGQGAGGISAHYHMVSPMSRDLINGVIAQSGTAISNNGLMPYYLSARFSKFLAERLDCPIYKEIDDMMDCLMSKEGSEIIETGLGLLEWDIEPITAFLPVMEYDMTDPFLPKDSVEIVLSGKAANVPFMTGITTNEGDFRTRLLFRNPELIEEFNEKFDNHIAMVLRYKDISRPINQKTATAAIKKFYFKNKALEDPRPFSKSFADALFLSSVNFASDMMAKHSEKPVYYYIFGYKGSHSYCDLIESDYVQDYGVCHSDDLMYLFNNDELFPNFERNDAENEVAHLMTKLWTNFAKYGNPTPVTDETILQKWEPYSLKNPKYNLIKDGKNVEALSEYLKGRTTFWSNLEMNERIDMLMKDRKTLTKDEL